MSAAITTRDLTKTFRGRTAVDGVDLHVPEGAVYGFLGPNGSGKSTAMKMLLGLTRPTRGTVALFGQPLTPASRPGLLASVGSMIEAPPGYGHLTGRENLRIVQRMLDLSDAQVDRALAAVRLTGQQHKRVGAYSLGMKQRLGIAIALARDPALLILDEPTNGLDPAGIEEIRALLSDLAGQGVTVMVSSHLLDEIERTAGVLGIIAGGRLLFQGTPAELFQQSIPDLVITTPDPEAALEHCGPGVREPGGIRLAGVDQRGAAAAVYRLAQAGVDVYEMRRVRHRLEDVFMDLTGRDGLQ